MTIFNSLFAGPFEVPGASAPTAPPVNGILPALSFANSFVGTTVSVNTGSWANNPTSIGYQWRNNGVNISGATTNTYTLQSGDIGDTITCRVTATNAIGSTTVTASGSITVAAAPALPVNSSLPTLTFANSYVGTTVSVSNGTWTNSPTYSYQWYTGSTPISDETTNTYTLQSGDIGNVITARVTATNAAGSVTATAPQSITVAAAPALPVNTVLPVLTFANSFVGTTVSTNNGTWNNSPDSYSYEWRNNGVAISGETNSTYTLRSGDIGDTITCRVTATNAGGSAAATSSNSITVAAAPEVLTLDPPVTSAIASDVVAAYGFSRLVEGYTGNTVRLRRLSDNNESNFTFGSDGIFTMTAVNSWRSGANVDVVHFFDQKGGAVNLTASGTMAFVRSNVVKRFGTTFSNESFSATKTNGSPSLTVADNTRMEIGMVVTGTGIPANSVIVSKTSTTGITLSQNATVTETSNIVVDNGLLTRSETLGAVGCDFASAGHLETTALTFDATSGVSVSMLYSHNTRKAASNASLVFGANATRENLFNYGPTATSFLQCRVTGGTIVQGLRAQTSSSHTLQQATQTLAKKQNAQQVATFTLSSSVLCEHSRAAREYNTTPSAQAITDLTAGTMNNGRLLIGSELVGSTPTTTNRLNAIFGGVILHKPLSDINRWTLIQKFNALGQEHLIDTVENIVSPFSDYILHKNINASTGAITGSKGVSTFNFNLPGMGTTVGTPTYTNNYTTPEIGIAGLRATNDNDNTYISNNAVPPSLNGTVVSLNMTESTGTNLLTDLAVHAGTPSSGTSVLPTDEFSFGICRDHNHLSAIFRPFDLSEISTRLLANRVSVFGKVLYDGANAPGGTYNRSTCNIAMIYGETISSVARDAAAWANQGPNSLGLDGPVISHVPENLNSLSKDNKLTLQVARYQAPAGYNPTDSQAARLALSLQSDNWHYTSQSTVMGHQEGNIARNRFGGVVQHKSTAKFQSFHGILQSFAGVRYFWAWTPDILTDEQIRKIDINMYKLVA